MGPAFARIAAACVAAIAIGSAMAAFAGGTDYGRTESWLARPEFDSAARLVPGDSGYRDLGDIARADAFYIHPTTGMNTDIDNVPVGDAEALATARLMLMAQATPFNGIARIYAPLYRQAALHVFDGDEAGVQAPMNLAYEDVRSAFRHYAQHDNRGRPFFLVAHSQGANHALRLLAEEILGTPMQDLLVAAYIPGMPVPRAVFDGPLAAIPPCAAPRQTGCVAAWGSFAEGYRDFGGWEAVNHFWDAGAGHWRSARGMPLANVNPISWTMDGRPATPAEHLGAVPFGVAGTHFSTVVPHLVGARNAQGYTLVSPAPLPAGLFQDGGIFDAGNYHVFDISLFWADIRANARRRLVAFLAAQGPSAGPLIEGPDGATASAGQPFRLRPVLLNGPAALRAEALPPGLSLDPATGTISGVPTAPGRFATLLTATNGRGSDTAELPFLVTGGDM